MFSRNCFDCQNRTIIDLFTRRNGSLAIFHGKCCMFGLNKRNRMFVDFNNSRECHSLRNRDITGYFRCICGERYFVITCFRCKFSSENRTMFYFRTGRNRSFTVLDSDCTVFRLVDSHTIFVDFGNYFYRCCYGYVEDFRRKNAGLVSFDVSDMITRLCSCNDFQSRTVHDFRKVIDFFTCESLDFHIYLFFFFGHGDFPQNRFEDYLNLFRFINDKLVL